LTVVLEVLGRRRFAVGSILAAFDAVERTEMVEVFVCAASESGRFDAVVVDAVELGGAERLSRNL